MPHTPRRYVDVDAARVFAAACFAMPCWRFAASPTTTLTPTIAPADILKRRTFAAARRFDVRGSAAV